MKKLAILVSSISLMSGLVGVAQADDASDKADYKAKMHDCVTQMKTDHADMNYKARRKACHKQLGPMPGAAAQPAAAPVTPPAKP